MFARLTMKDNADGNVEVKKGAGFKPYRNLVLGMSLTLHDSSKKNYPGIDTMKLYTVAHGHKVYFLPYVWS